MLPRFSIRGTILFTSLAGVNAGEAPQWEVELSCHSAAVLGERRPAAVTPAWAPGCGPGTYVPQSSFC